MDSSKQLCRVCLTTTESFLTDITLQNDPENKLNFRVAFETVTSIYINDFDKYRFLCNNCIEKLFKAYDFRCQALRSYEELQQSGYAVATELSIKKENEYYSESEEFEAQNVMSFDPDIKLESENYFEEELNTSGSFKERKKKRKQNTTKQIPTLNLNTNFLNKAYCRFCLKHFPSKIGQHEREHISEYCLINNVIIFCFF